MRIAHHFVGPFVGARCAQHNGRNVAAMCGQSEQRIIVVHVEQQQIKTDDRRFRTDDLLHIGMAERIIDKRRCAVDQIDDLINGGLVSASQRFRLLNESDFAKMLGNSVESDLGDVTVAPMNGE